MFVTDFVQLARHVESTDLPTTRASTFSVPFALQLQLNLFLLFPSPSTSISSFPHPLKKILYSRFSNILFSPTLPPPSFPFSLSIRLLLRVLSRQRKKGSCLSGGGGLSLIKLFARRRNQNGHPRLQFRLFTAQTVFPPHSAPFEIPDGDGCLCNIIPCNIFLIL